eukprot:COSAG03_NODE_189_length_10920_cov_16.612328_7_plen_323_part_00
MSGVSLAAAGLYLFLRVMFACDGCLTSGYGEHLSVCLFVCLSGCLRVCVSGCLPLCLSASLLLSLSLSLSLSLPPPPPPPSLFDRIPQNPVALVLTHGAARGTVARDIVQQQHLAIAAALLAAGVLDMLYGAAVYTKRRFEISATRSCRSCFAVFEADWVHEGWFGSIAAIGLIFISHPQADAHNALIHVIIGVALVLGAHTIVNERRNGFLPKLVLANAAVDGETTVAAPAAMDAIATAPRGLVAAGMCFMCAAIGLAAFRESKSEHVGVDVACSPAGYALVVGTECWSAALVVSAAMVAVLRNARGTSDGGDENDAAVFG